MATPIYFVLVLGSRHLDQHTAEIVGAENSVTSRDLHVLVYQAAEAVSSQWPDDLVGGRGSVACGRVLVE